MCVCVRVCVEGGLIEKIFYSKIYFNKITFFHVPGKHFCNYSIFLIFCNYCSFYFFMGEGGGERSFIRSALSVSETQVFSIKFR